MGVSAGDVNWVDWLGLPELVAQVSNLLPKIGLGLVIILVFCAAGNAAQRVVRRFFERHYLNPDVEELLDQIVRIVLVAMGLVTGLGTMGVDIAGLVAGLGLVGFAVGFALKDAISNLLSGVLLLIYHPFERGDVINVAGKGGRVVDIDLRYTRLETDAQCVLVPNSALFSNVVVVEKPTAEDA